MKLRQSDESGEKSLEVQFVDTARTTHGTDHTDPPYLRAIDRTVEAVVAIALAGEVAAVFMNAIARSVLGTSLLWTEEVAAFALSILAKTPHATDSLPVQYNETHSAQVKPVAGFYPD